MGRRRALRFGGDACVVRKYAQTAGGERKRERTDRTERLPAGESRFRHGFLGVVASSRLVGCVSRVHRRFSHTLCENYARRSKRVGHSRDASTRSPRVAGVADNTINVGSLSPLS
ncbi:hypothetical protein D8S78_22515 [Natrialba swarupiae]|nr:hypothetical protein [Natrialba swarupiae]